MDNRSAHTERMDNLLRTEVIRKAGSEPFHAGTKPLSFNLVSGVRAGRRERMCPVHATAAGGQALALGEEESQSMAKLLDTMLRTLTLTIASGLLLTGCSGEGDLPEPGLDGAADASVNLVNKVWQVDSSSGVAPGTFYVFLSEGTLLITSSGSKPLLGTWKYEGGELVMVEDGIPYKTEILQLEANRFRIRNNNPGEPVQTTLVPAEADFVPK